MAKMGNVKWESVDTNETKLQLVCTKVSAARRITSHNTDFGRPELLLQVTKFVEKLQGHQKKVFCKKELEYRERYV